MLIALLSVGALANMFAPAARGGKVLQLSWISEHLWGWVFVPVLGVLIVLGMLAVLQSFWALLCLLAGKESRWADKAYRPYGVHHDNVDMVRRDMQAERVARTQAAEVAARSGHGSNRK